MLCKNKYRQIYITFNFFILLFLSSSSYAQALGTQEIEFTIPGTDRNLVAEVYYPTTEKLKENNVDYYAVWRRRQYVRNAPLKPNPQLYPLIIFSHGFQGDRFGNSWVAEVLVDEGYIVAIIDHTHNTSYDHNDEFAYSSQWQRPADMSALLTHLLDYSAWSRVIDKSKVAAGGFSLGGTTALWLAGIEGDAQAFKEAMEPYLRWSMWPQSIKNRVSAVDWSKSNFSYYDNRLKAVFSISPDLGKGFKPQGIRKAKIPVLLVVGGKDKITPAKTNAYYYYTHLNNAKYLAIKEAEHSTFLNHCSDFGKQIIPSLCQDKPPIDRLKVHQEAAKKIKLFLQKEFQRVPNIESKR